MKCKCGHNDYDHYPKGKQCVERSKDGSWCKCKKFRPKDKQT